MKAYVPNERDFVESREKLRCSISEFAPEITEPLEILESNENVCLEINRLINQIIENNNKAKQEMLEILKECDDAMCYMSEYYIPINLPNKVRDVIIKYSGRI